MKLEDIVLVKEHVKGRVMNYLSTLDDVMLIHTGLKTDSIVMSGQIAFDFLTDKKYNYSMRRSYMAKMGRPKSDNPMDKKVSVRFNQQEYDILLEYARTHEMTVTQVIKLCVEMKLLAKQ